MNGKSFDVLKNKRRESASGGAPQNYAGPGDVEAAAREYNIAVVFTDVSAIDASTTITRYIEDSWNGDTWVTIYTDTVTTTGPIRKEVANFAAFLRVRHEVKHNTQSSLVGASFGSGITYKQT